MLRNILFLVCTCSLGWSQAPTTPGMGPTPSVVNLMQAMREAMNGNLGFLAEKANITVAEARIITAGLKPNPILSLSSDHLDVLGTGYSAQNSAGPAEHAAQIN